MSGLFSGLDPQVVAFAGVAAALTVAPGADTMLVLKNAVRGGRSAGWATTAGILSGCLLHAVLSAVGLSVILMRSALAFQSVKLAGAAYLVWIGIRTFRGGGRTDAGEQPLRAAAVPLAASFREGFVTNVLNPKVSVFYLAFLPQFISPGDPVLAKSVLLACIHNAMGALWLGSLSAVAARGRTWMSRPRIRRGIARVSGAVLVALGVRLALERR
jgi:RhtB (resistance to homoserine/threonine) family protein